VASAGDVNGDGFPDLIVGAPAHDAAAGPGCGKVFVYYGSADVLPSSPSWTAEGEQTGSLFGAAVASAGDVNGDGFGDIVIGAPGFDSGPEFYERDSGRLYVYLGSAQGLAAAPALVFDGRPSDLGGPARLGTSVTAGDFNADGFSDVVGAEFSRYVGGADVFYGSASGPSPASSWSYGPQSGRALGSSVAAADVNGDGYDDLVVTSAPDEDDAPSARIYLGSPGGLANVPGGWPPPGAPPDLGVDGLSNVLNVGDLDGDGYEDLLAVYGGAQFGSIVPYHAFYRGSPSGPILARRLGGVLDPRGQLDRLGDMNGDGFPDFVARDGSSVYFYFGSAAGFRPLSDGMITLDAAVSGAGDVNRDGFDDLVVGDAAHERVDVYRGGTDWTFHVAGDVSVQQEVWALGAESMIDITVANAGPETVRVRLVDHFPPSTGPAWYCWTLSSGPVSATCLNDPYPGPLALGDIDSVITLAPGGGIRYTVGLGVVSLPVANTASIVAPDWFIDPDPSNNQSTAVLGPAQEGIFADGFESGGFSAWSSHSASGLAVLPAAALEGQYGLQVTASPRGTAAVVRDASPSGENAYHARFRFDPNGFGARVGRAAARPAARTILFSGQGPAGPLFEVVLEPKRDKLFLVGRAAVDDGSVSQTERAAVTDAAHVIDIGWRRATGPGANNGLVVVQIDGRPAGSLANLDNDAGGGVDSVELGLTGVGSRPPFGAHRTVFLDAFESWRLQ
jgi:hypothetical protein